MSKNIRTTIIGGIVFLIPLIFIMMILGRAYELAIKVATPISKLIPIQGFAGVALVDFLALVLVLAVCFLAGLAARSSLISTRVEKLDRFLEHAVPVYHSTKKGIMNSVEAKSMEDDWKVVLVGNAGDKRWLGFEVERLANKDVVVFQPLSPNTTTGFVWTVPPVQVEKVDLEPRKLSKLLRSHGIGVAESV